MEQSLRHIAPAGGDSKRKTPPPVTSTTTEIPKRRSAVRVACDACRVKKVACSGVRPVCGRCQERGIDCVYLSTNKEETYRSALKRQVEFLQVKLQEHSQVLEHLITTLEEGDAIRFLQQLRSTSDISSAHRMIREDPHRSHQPYEHETIHTGLQEMSSNFEIELSVLHPLAYPHLSPVDSSTIDIGDLAGLMVGSLDMSDTNLQKPPDFIMEEQFSIQADPKDANPVAEDSILRQTALEKLNVRSPSILRSLRSTLQDHRLQQLNIQYWTKVPISNEFASAVICMYLETDHLIHGFLEADLFLHDLTNCVPNFCSSLLVSSLLALACLSYAAVDERAFNLSGAFFEEASLWWHAERCRDSISTTLSSQLLSICASLNGRDDLGLALFKDGRRMAERLELFGIATSNSVSERFSKLTSNKSRWAAQAAWGVFNWQVLHAFLYQDEPVLFAPILPIPGFDLNEQESLHIDWPTSRYRCESFTARCKLQSIVHEFAAIYLPPQAVALVDRVPLGFVESKYRQLLEWMDCISGEIARKDDSAPHVVVLHMLYHCAILDLFRPFLQKEYRFIPLNSFASHNSSPDAVYKASLSQLKRLLIIFRQQNTAEFCTAFINNSVIEISIGMLNIVDDPERKFYLLLCLSLTQDMFVCYPVFELQMQAILAMAIQDGMISSLEACQIMENLRRKGLHHGESRNLVARFAINPFRALISMEKAQVQAIANRFDELVMFDEFVSHEQVDFL